MPDAAPAAKAGVHLRWRTPFHKTLPTSDQKTSGTMKLISPSTWRFNSWRDSSVSGSSWDGITHFAATLASRTKTVNDPGPRGSSPQQLGRGPDSQADEREARPCARRTYGAGAILLRSGRCVPTGKSPLPQSTGESRERVSGEPGRDRRGRFRRRVSA